VAKKSKTHGIRFTEELWERIGVRAEKSGLSRNEWIVFYCDQGCRLEEIDERQDAPPEPEPAAEEEPPKPRERTLAQELADADRTKARRKLPHYYDPPNLKRTQAELAEYERSWSEQIRKAGGNPYG
jgi:hypothetical protein